MKRCGAGLAAARISLAALLLLPPLPMAGQEGQEGPTRIQAEDPESIPRPVATATRIRSPIIIDASLDEEAWDAAELLDRFIQSQPDPGVPATEPTVVRILYDDEHLYVGAIMYQSDAARLVVRSLERDFPGQSTRDADMFGIALDTFLDRRNSLIYLVNPYGAVRDGQTFDDSRNMDFGWDGAVRIATRIHDEGWTLEMAIPWNSLRYHPTTGEQAWGLNLLRRVRGKNEDSYWAPVHRRDPVHRMSKAGTLVGLKDLPENRNLSVKPYLLGEQQGGSLQGPGEGGVSADAGFDLKYGVTPGLTLDLTFRTDFSQVEVDQEHVNLTRFPLFFPERRDFFVENSGSFVFGDVTERNYRMGTSLRDFTLFHSRRIGMENGRPTPILGGGRLTGQAGGLEVGLMTMQTQGTEGLPAENFSVARVRREIGSGGDVGAILVNRTTTSGGDHAYNRSFGVDLNLRFLEGFIVNSYLAGTQAPDLAGDRSAARIGIAWRDRHWNASALVRRIGEGFDPGVGFVRRRDVRQGFATLGTHRRPGIPNVQEVAPYVSLNYVTSLESLLLTRMLEGGLDVEFFDGGSLGVTASRRFERLQVPFQVQNVTIPVGDYDFREFEASYASSAARLLSGAVRIGSGGYFGGDRRWMGLSATWFQGHRLSLEGSLDVNDVDLPAGSFTSNVYRGRVRFALSTRAFTSVLIQYNDAEEQLVSNVRFNLVHAPLSDLFVVYTERRDLRDDRVLERLATLKITRYLQF
jgi:hypothetical protein